MKELISLYRLEGHNVVFVMDNATIHKHEIEQLCETYGCKVLFNAPYSPECNPIELVFGFRKTQVEKLTNVDIASLLGNIAACFEVTSVTDIKASIAHFLGPVTVRIRNMEDL